MLTIGGLLLGAALGAQPSATSATAVDPLLEPFGSAPVRVAIAAPTGGPRDLRDPFADPDPIAVERRVVAIHRESDVLRDPFTPHDQPPSAPPTRAPEREPLVAPAPASVDVAEPLVAPAPHPAPAPAPETVAPSHDVDLRDPFVR